MKIACLIPTRGDRPGFLENCLRMLRAQTYQPIHIEIVDDKPLNDECDITYRYRIGYERLRNKGFDAILFIEEDDFYAPNYIDTMVINWINCGKPDLFGTTYTLYYHIKLFRHLVMHHRTRSSAMNTLIKPDLNFKWCDDNNPYTDIYLWELLKGSLFKPVEYICIGIKHGVGLCGGELHKNKLDRYFDSDSDKSLLKKHLDKDSFTFYSDYFLGYNKLT